MQVKSLPLFTLLFSLVASNFAYSLDYPNGPHPDLTPGSLCDRPSYYRYPEKIAYCERDVSTDLKAEIFHLYREQLGYKLDISRRADYKIDHFIPLCAGGSNHADNLWPQHVTIFSITDPLESLGCEILSKGAITQKELIGLIRKAKFNVAEAPKIILKLQALKK